MSALGRLALLVACGLATSGAATAGLVASEPDETTRRWHRSLVAAEELLQAGKPSRAAKKANEVAAEIVGKAWRDAESIALLAECALVQAVAHTRLDDVPTARWYYAMAILTDRAVDERPLAGYAAEAAVLRAIPQRVHGRPPLDVEVVDLFDPRVKRPQLAEDHEFGLVNDAAWADGTQTVVVEVVVNRDGSFSHPVPVSVTPPIVLYHVLEELYERRAEPARRRDDAVDVLWEVTVDLSSERW